MKEQTQTIDLVRDYKDIKADYAYVPDIMTEEPERVRLLKMIITKRLSVVDRTIILLYADCQSYRKLGKKMHLSHMTIRREVKRIQNIIIDEYNKLK